MQRPGPLLFEFGMRVNLMQFHFDDYEVHRGDQVTRVFDEHQREGALPVREHRTPAVPSTKSSFKARETSPRSRNVRGSTDFARFSEYRHSVNITSTTVPIGVTSKNSFAAEFGMRMHPWLAGLGAPTDCRE